MSRSVTDVLATDMVSQAGLLARGEMSAVQLIERQLAAIEASQPTINSYLHLDGDGALAANNGIDAPWVNADIFGQPVLADSHRLQELLQQYFAGMDRGYYSVRLLLHGRYISSGVSFLPRIARIRRIFLFLVADVRVRHGDADERRCPWKTTVFVFNLCNSCNSWQNSVWGIMGNEQFS